MAIVFKDEVPEDIFWDVLERNGGLFSHTARSLSVLINHKIQAESVQRRANHQPERYKLIRQSLVDLAEAVVVKTIEQTDNPKLAFDASVYYLDRQGKERGFGKSSEVSITDGNMVPYHKAMLQIQEKIKSNPHLQQVIAASAVDITPDDTADALPPLPLGVEV